MLDGRIDFGEGVPEGGVFGVAVEEDLSFGGDEDHAGDAVDLKESGEGTFLGFEKPGHVVHAQIVSDSFGGGLLVFIILVHADDDDVMRSECLVFLPEGGHELHAGTAPRGPEVDEEGLLALNEITEGGGFSARGREDHVHVHLEAGHFLRPAPSLDALEEDLGLFGGFPDGFKDLFFVGFQIAVGGGGLGTDVVGKGFNVFLGTETGGVGGIKILGEDLDLGQDLFQEGLVLAAKAPDELGLDDLLAGDSGAGSLFDGRIKVFLAETIGE